MQQTAVRRAPVGRSPNSPAAVGKLADLFQREKFCMIGLMAVGTRLAGDGAQKQDHVNAIAAVGIVAAAQAQDSFDFSRHPRFFLNFSDHGLFDGLIGFDKTTRQLPITRPWRDDRRTNSSLSSRTTAPPTPML